MMHRSKCWELQGLHSNMIDHRIQLVTSVQFSHNAIRCVYKQDFIHGLQLKVKDLEGALETEKFTCTETSSNFDSLNQQHKLVVWFFVDRA